MDNEIKKEHIWFGILLILILLFGYLLASGVVFRNNGHQVSEIECNNGETLIDSKCVKNIEDQGSQELSDFEKYESYKKVSIYPKGLVTPDDYIENAGEYLNDDGTDGVGRTIEVTGEIADAYLYVKAGANDAGGNFVPILQRYDSIYFYLRNGIYLGGHLDLGKSTLGKPSELTEVLFNLNKMPLAENLDAYRNNEFKTIDLLGELNGIRRIGALVSTARYGKIEQLIIGYKCKGEEDSCSIR